MVPDNTTQRQSTDLTPGPISWWSWRPGIRPLYALLLGIPFTFLALLLVLLGAATLIAGIEDSASPPLLVPAVVVGRSTVKVVNQMQLTLRLQKSASRPEKATFTVINASTIPLNAQVLVSYSPRLHVAYALEYAGRQYAMQGSSAAGNPFGSILFLLLGLLLFPYPVLLLHWGWRDLLIARYDRARLCGMRARIVVMRETSRGRQPGFAGRGARLWYGVALRSDDGATRTFSISEESYRSLSRDMLVRVVYSPHLHYVYTIVETEPG